MIFYELRSSPLRLTTEDTAKVVGARTYNDWQKKVNGGDNGAEDKESTFVPTKKQHAK